jgi:hypothetical protein
MANYKRFRGQGNLVNLSLSPCGGGSVRGGSCPRAKRLFSVSTTGKKRVYDLLDYLEKRNATSHNAALVHLEVARRYGPAVAGAVRITEGLYESRVHIGYGLNAVFELEEDRAGIVQPVLGKIVKR